MRNWMKIIPLAAGSLLLMGNHNYYYQYWEPVSVTYMYSDATYQTEVGSISPTCGPRYAQYQLQGTYTNYQVDQALGYCTEWGLQLLEAEH
ncbi:MAG TPA: hypothetical protein VE891_07570 [Allosphingosinicella sp.]|nr:hypothetical protein [Allosphingosinicella sp.]